MTDQPRVHRWPAGLYRVAVTIAAVLAFDQAVLAGQFLSGSYAGLRLHRDMSTWTVGAIGAVVIAAVLWRVAGRGPKRIVPAAIALFVLTALQTFLGYRLILAAHIPLGVAVIVLMTVLAVHAWRRPR